ncbi:MAG: oxidoreductase FAD/NAD(P)-binding domain-containing protein [Armatimonadetes bacterium CSP1-3]|nr:MAG: oxidoreductase FAD/NAD(P)-binding domain-containing protein [Armatimonadetes bacterium CSP1-3]
MAMLQVAEPTAAVGPVVPRLFRVRGRRRETRDTITVDLQAVAPADESGFTPGQFNMLYIFGTGEVPISISGDPGRVDFLAHTVRAVGAVTQSLAAMKRGALVGVRGPFGTSWPVEAAEGSDVVIVGGGIGLAPLRPVLYRLLARREKFGRIVLLYGARTPGDLLYVRELERWRSRMDLDVEVTVDAAAGSWRGNVGVVTTLIPRAPFDPASSVALVCGPEVMMRFTVRELQARGVRDDRMFLSMERNMKCGVGQCGHCQYGPFFICRDGPVFPYGQIAPFFRVREI